MNIERPPQRNSIPTEDEVIAWLLHHRLSSKAAAGMAVTPEFLLSAIREYRQRGFFQTDEALRQADWEYAERFPKVG